MLSHFSPRGQRAYGEIVLVGHRRQAGEQVLNVHECGQIQGNVLPLDVATGCLFLLNLLTIKLAEREGFEPSVPYGTPDFESGAFDHSATSP